MNYEDYKALRMKSWRFRLLYGFRRMMLRFWIWWDKWAFFIIIMLICALLLMWVSQTEKAI